MALSNKEIMSEARGALKGKWGIVIGTTVIYLVMTIILGSIPKVGFLINLVIGGPLCVGLSFFFLSLIRGKELEVKYLFDGFSAFANNLAAYILVLIFVLLWALLLIIPGIIAAFSYSMTYYILADNENTDAMAAIRKSKEMMKGNKGKLFFLYCRFIGWFLLGIVTLGIGFLWITPYFMTSLARFYEDLKEKTEIPTATNI